MSPYREKAPAELLSRWVECCWSLCNEEAIQNHPVRPDGCIDLIFSLDGGLRVVGTMTSEMRYDLPASSLTVGIRFHPGMAQSFFAMPAAELTDRSLAAKELFGARAKEAESRLRAARCAAECLAIMTAAAGAPKPLSSVQLAIESITARAGVADLGQIAAQANLSPRQFRRRCLDVSGIAPNQLCRILRFRNAMRLAESALKPNWAGIALAAGYFDQSHLIRDFRGFGAGAPMSVFSKTA